MAAEFGGFAAVDAMSWHDYQLARQYLVESRIGTRIREAQHIEQAQARSNAKALSSRR